jgi:hypothetical protein
MTTTELWALNHVENLAGDTITNNWTAVPGWVDTYVLAATLALLLLMVVALVSRRRKSEMKIAGA